VAPLRVSAAVAGTFIDSAAAVVGSDPSAAASFTTPLTDSLNADSSALSDAETFSSRCECASAGLCRGT